MIHPLGIRDSTTECDHVDLSTLLMMLGNVPNPFFRVLALKASEQVMDKPSICHIKKSQQQSCVTDALGGTCSGKM
jgi:hypothetical protein